MTSSRDSDGWTTSWILPFQRGSRRASGISSRLSRINRSSGFSCSRSERKNPLSLSVNTPGRFSTTIQRLPSPSSSRNRRILSEYFSGFSLPAETNRTGRFSCFPQAIRIDVDFPEEAAPSTYTQRYSFSACSSSSVLSI